MFVLIKGYSILGQNSSGTMLYGCACACAHVRVCAACVRLQAVLLLVCSTYFTVHACVRMYVHMYVCTTYCSQPIAMPPPDRTCLQCIRFFEHRQCACVPSVDMIVFLRKTELVYTC